MIREKSVGVIVYRYNPREKDIQYLVLYVRGNYWNFPKGKVEPGETEIQTAKRELAEETMIKNIQIEKGWRRVSQFSFKEDREGKKEAIKKDFVLYLAKLPKGAKVDISGEHNGFDNGYAWLNYNMACKYLKFKSLKEAIKSDDEYIKKQQRGHMNKKSVNNKKLNHSNVQRKQA